MVAAGAFFVIGFDLHKTVIGGVARLIGIVIGIVLAILLFSQVEPGPFLQVIMVVIGFLVFALAPVHPSFLMMFLTVFLASGWAGMQADALELTISEKIVGELAGVIVAMIAIVVLQQWDKKRRADNPLLSE